MDQIQKTARALLQREAWKYDDINKYLNSINEPHRFEFNIPYTPFIYDLLLINKRLIIEFDAQSHESKSQRMTDTDKDIVAEENGYEVIRVRVEPNTIISRELIKEYCCNCQK